MQVDKCSTLPFFTYFCVIKQPQYDRLSLQQLCFLYALFRRKERVCVDCNCDADRRVDVDSMRYMAAREARVSDVVASLC